MSGSGVPVITVNSRAEHDAGPVPLEGLRVSAFRIPTDFPESDGTFQWDSTTLVVVELDAAGASGLGYTYADQATALFVREHLAEVIRGRDAMGIPAAWELMVSSVRNLGHPGIASMAISAVDSALWDLKGKLLGLPLVTMLGSAQESAPIYGSGGFTSYSIDRLREQLRGWVESGIPRVKMKIGRDPAADVERVRAARDAIGPDAELFVDANGAYDRKQALAQAAIFVDSRVTWFEEPVPSDDVEGLRLTRDNGPAGMAIAAGEYGYRLLDFRCLLEAGAVDVLQADATRCGGITGFLRTGALCRAFGLPFSAHCAPALHHQVACSLANLRHIEYFHDHARIEGMLFDGAPRPERGALRPDLSRPGLGLEFKRRDAEPYAV